ncbi:MAG: hypothetical protein IJA60_02675 [Clostridia bacterium]|nr:hypothetical protein [Clostridia bacterium]
MDDAVFTPFYRGTAYLYHECSECQYHVHMYESVSTPLYFGETFKYCPNCGKPVIRFANLPKFKEEFNRTIFKGLIQIDDEYKNRLDYYCRVTLSEEEFLDLREKCKFAESLKSNGDIAALSPAISKVAKMSAAPWNHWNIKKLKEKVESNG